MAFGPEYIGGLVTAFNRQFPWRISKVEGGGAWAIFALMLLENIFPPIPSELIMPLAGMARRGLIAGRLSNTRENMVTWLRAPQKVDPHTAMPDLRVTEADAHDIAAYLDTLH